MGMRESKKALLASCTGDLMIQISPWRSCIRWHGYWLINVVVYWMLIAVRILFAVCRFNQIHSCTGIRMFASTRSHNVRRIFSRILGMKAKVHVWKECSNVVLNGAWQSLNQQARKVIFQLVIGNRNYTTHAYFLYHIQNVEAPRVMIKIYNQTWSEDET